MAFFAFLCLFLRQNLDSHSGNGSGRVLSLVLPAGVCLPSACHREDVRLQETGEETDQKEEGRGHGPERKTDPGKSEQ